MSLTRLLSLLSVTAAALGSPLATLNHARSGGKIAWGPCEFNGSLPIQCGNLSVPLDYTNAESTTRLDLQLLKVPARYGPKKGSVLLNFGGPGLEARHTLASTAKILQTLTGGYYDLIAHDPRGTENTLTYTCFRNNDDRLVASDMSRFADLVTPSDRAALGRLWATSSIFADICSQNPESKERGQYISTVFTARDLMQIVDAVEDDGMLRYWGFSYGTALGATVAAMFPDKIDRIIIDGVVNIHEYHKSYDVELWADTDKVFSAFFKQCVKSPKECPLAGSNITAEYLEKAMYKLLDEIKYQPIAFNNTIIDHSAVKNLIRPNLYSPSTWPVLSLAFGSLLEKNYTKFSQVKESLITSFGGGTVTEAAFGIPCSDKGLMVDDFDEIKPTLKALNKESKLLGQVGSALAMTCSQWKIKAKERYTGDFQVKLKHPMLVIGNTYDPATSFASAKNASATFRDSILLEHGGYGHTTLNHASVCTGKAIKDYFMRGILPMPGTVCDASYPPFADKSWNDFLDQI